MQDAACQCHVKGAHKPITPAHYYAASTSQAVDKGCCMPCKGCAHANPTAAGPCAQRTPNWRLCAFSAPGTNLNKNLPESIKLACARHLRHAPLAQHKSLFVSILWLRDIMYDTACLAWAWAMFSTSMGMSMNANDCPFPTTTYTALESVNNSLLTHVR
jgi:hypothetical protein